MSLRGESFYGIGVVALRVLGARALGVSSSVGPLSDFIIVVSVLLLPSRVCLLLQDQYSVFSNCSSTVTVSPSGPPGLFKGVTTAMSGVIDRFPLLLPVRNPVAGYGGLCRHSYPGPRTCGRSEKPMSSGWRGLNPGFQRNLSPP